MSARWFAALLALAPSQALAITLYGSDLGGLDLSPVDGDVLEGVFTNVGTFTVPAGVTVFASRGVALEIYADVVVISGELSGVGAGESGGAPGFAPAAGAVAGSRGLGLGAGGFGGPGVCVHGGGGGGGAFGGAGGEGAYYFGPPDIGAPGVAYGAIGFPYADPVERPLGSGGGGGGSGCAPADGGRGGAGGGSLLIEANTLTVDGRIDFSGADGRTGTGAAGAGGGGSGGSLVLVSGTLNGSGALVAAGGNGGDCVLGIGGLAGGGGGGGGGRLKLFLAPGYSVFTDVSGGTFGVNQFTGYDGTEGGVGTVHQEELDTDGDGIREGQDNCPGLYNPDQADSNGNGVGDLCDPCGAMPDDDADGVCNASDVCPGFDDLADSDGDGVADGCDRCEGGDDAINSDDDLWPDACDVCPLVNNPNQTDADLDGYGSACDCNDANDNMGPGIAEVCDGLDNDCNGQVDGADAVDARLFYADLDEDGEGDPNSAIGACERPDNYALNNTDCDDSDIHVRTSAPEVCDGLDNDCDGVVDYEGCVTGEERQASKEAAAAAVEACGCTSAPTGPSGLWLMLPMLPTLLRRR